MKSNCRIGLLAMAAVLLPGAARGAVIVANTGIETNGLGPFGSNQLVAAQFTSPSVATSVTSVDLKHLGFLGVPTFSLRLFSDTAGFPNSSLASLGSQSVGVAGTYTYTPGAPVVLGPATSYWLVADCSNCNVNTLGLWSVSASPPTVVGLPGANVGTGVAFSIDSGTTWQADSQFTFIFQVNGDTVTNGVPEPGAAVLLGLGLGATWFARRRTK